MIEVAHLTRRFGSVLAVDDLSFSLEKGEVVGFLGPNGAGKTTAMRMLTGYLPATSAERLSVAGFDVLRQSMDVRRRIGYLPESVPLYREMRVGEMMRFQGRLHRMDRASLKRRIPEVLEQVGVADRESQLVGKLSRGLRQRVGLAVALLPMPEVLILDEPTSGLDPLQRAEVRALIHELASEHTVLLSSHILAEIESICPRVIILREGRLAADGTPGKLLEEMGGSGHVAFEAVVGDAAAAETLLASLPGVERVLAGERVGIHQAFAIHGQGDLREDVGALAMVQGWAVRELSWCRPTLEQLFARLVLGTDGGEWSATAPVAREPESQTPELQPPESKTIGLELAPDSKPEPELGTPGQKKIIYSLNPFDQGGSRDLTRPMDTQADAPPADGERCDSEGEST
jgi:gliding motility-associated transport system ATP-binding protein